MVNLIKLEVDSIRFYCLGNNYVGKVEHLNALARWKRNDPTKSLEAAIGVDSLGEGFEIGHSYFCGQTTVTDEWLHQVIDYDLIPTLQEYWFDSKTDVNRWKAELNSIFND